jgi:hypothetical protein
MPVPIPAALLAAAGIGSLEALRRRGTDAYDVANYDPLATIALDADESLPLPPRPPSSPVVTASPTARAPQSGGDLPQSAQDLLARLRANTNSTENQSAQSADTATAPPDQNSTAMDRLANFGFAMAASRNPSLFGQIGEAGLAMQRGDRERRQDDIRQQQVDVEQEYRRAQVDLARAEAAWQQDPDNPRNVALLAEARYRLAMADRAVRGGEGGVSEGQGIPIEREDGTFGVFYPRTGRVAVAPEGVSPMGATANTPEQRRLTDWNNRRAQFEQSLFQNPMFASQAARENALREWTGRNPRPVPRMRGAGALPNAPVESPDRPVYDLTGRPVTR